MKATHNIKINGRWYTAGEELPESKAETVEPVVEQTVMQETEPVKEAEKPEPKPKTSSSSRRRSAK